MVVIAICHNPDHFIITNFCRNTSFVYGKVVVCLGLVECIYGSVYFTCCEMLPKVPNEKWNLLTANCNYLILEKDQEVGKSLQ